MGISHFTFLSPTLLSWELWRRDKVICCEGWQRDRQEAGLWKRGGNTSMSFSVWNVENCKQACSRSISFWHHTFLDMLLVITQTDVLSAWCFDTAVSCLSRKAMISDWNFGQNPKNAVKGVYWGDTCLGVQVVLMAVCIIESLIDWILPFMS